MFFRSFNSVFPFTEFCLITSLFLDIIPLDSLCPTTPSFLLFFPFPTLPFGPLLQTFLELDFFFSSRGIRPGQVRFARPFFIPVSCSFSCSPQPPPFCPVFSMQPAVSLRLMNFSQLCFCPPFFIVQLFPCRNCAIYNILSLHRRFFPLPPTSLSASTSKPSDLPRLAFFFISVLLPSVPFFFLSTPVTPYLSPLLLSWLADFMRLVLSPCFPHPPFRPVFLVKSPIMIRWLRSCALA